MLRTVRARTGPLKMILLTWARNECVSTSCTVVILWFLQKKSLSNLSLEMLIISNGHFPLMNDSEPWCFEFTNHKLWNINFLTAFTLIFQVVCYWNDCESCFQIRYGQSQNAFTFESFLCKLNIVIVFKQNLSSSTVLNRILNR